MTNQEINEAIARKLGLWLSDPPNIRVGPTFMNGVPDYATDISAAWEIVEYCFKNRLSVDFTSEYGGKWFEVQINRNKHLGKGLFEIDGFWTGEADTAPMAICLAFLKMDGFVADAPAE